VPLQLPPLLLEVVASKRVAQPPYQRCKCEAVAVSGTLPVEPVMPRLVLKVSSPVAVESATWKTPDSALVHVTWEGLSPPPVCKISI
jgi:hypothetical protein